MRESHFAKRATGANVPRLGVRLKTVARWAANRRINVSTRPWDRGSLTRRLDGFIKDALRRRLMTVVVLDA